MKIDEHTETIVNYVIKFLKNKNINPVRIIKDDIGYVNVYVNDKVFTPKLCDEAWFRTQREFNVDFPRVLVDSDLFLWESDGTCDLSNHFLKNK